jgi:hypothetical protein
MYIEAVPNKANKPAILLRECYREKGKVVKRTLANLSHLPTETIENLRIALKGGQLIDVETLKVKPQLEDTLPHGHVLAVMTAMKRLNINALLEPIPSVEKNIICGLIVARILNPKSKLATVRFWSTCSLASELQLEKKDEDDIYKAINLIFYLINI